MLKLLCLVPWHQASSREIFRFKLQNPDPEIQLAAMEVLLLVDYGVGACGRSIVLTRKDRNRLPSRTGFGDMAGWHTTTRTILGLQPHMAGGGHVFDQARREARRRW